MSNPLSTFDATEIPGQAVLPGFSELLGVEAAALKKPEHELFCVKYVELRDTAMAYQAAIDKDCSRLQAQKNAHFLMKKQEIVRRINQIQSVYTNRMMFDVQASAYRAMNFDPANYFEASGRRIPLHELPEHLRRGVGLEARIVEGCVVYVPVFPSPEKGRTDSMKLLGMDKQALELTGKGGGPISTESKVQFYIPGNGRD